MAKWGRPGQGKILVSQLKKKNYIQIGDVLYPPNSPEAKSHKSSKPKRSRINRTGWTDDIRNIRNKEKYVDPFVRLIREQLEVDVWPEFYFSTERNYRVDYALPDHKIAIECDGGIWMRGNSGHSSGTGIKRDMDKGNLLTEMGWRLIRRTPDELLTMETIRAIKKLIS